MDTAADRYTPDTERSRVTVSRAMTEASGILKKRGNLALLVTTFLFCLLVTFAWYTVIQLLSILFAIFTLGGVSTTVSLLLNVLYYVLSALLFFIGVMPAWLGRLRLAGRMCLGDTPMAREVLYYYTSFRRAVRAILTGLLLAFQVLLPAVLILGAFVGVFALYDHVLWAYLDDGPAILLTVIGCILSAAVAVAILMLTGFYQLTTAIAVGDESRPVWSAFADAFRYGRRNPGAIFLFSLKSLWHLILSLCTFGVLFLFWYAHHYILSYLRLSMALCKGDDPS